MHPIILKDMAFSDFKSLEDFVSENGLSLFYNTGNKTIAVKGDKGCIMDSEATNVETLHLVYKGGNQISLIRRDEESDKPVMGLNFNIESVEVSNFKGDRIPYSLETSPAISDGFILS